MIDLEAIRARDAQWVSKPWHDFVAYAVDPTKPFAKDGQNILINDRRALLAEVDQLRAEIQNLLFESPALKLKAELHARMLLEGAEPGPGMPIDGHSALCKRCGISSADPDRKHLAAAHQAAQGLKHE